MDFINELLLRHTVAIFLLSALLLLSFLFTLFLFFFPFLLHIVRSMTIVATSARTYDVTAVPITRAKRTRRMDGRVMAANRTRESKNERFRAARR